MAELVVAFSIISWLIITPFAIYYLVIGNAYGQKYIGTLQYVEVNSGQNCNRGGCSDYYYVSEIFTKGNSNNTCSVDRMTHYGHKSQANHFADDVILGTTRTIWTNYNNHKVCYDQTIKTFNNQVGYSLLSFSILCMLILIICAFKYR